MYRIGIGFDAHSFAVHRKLIIGGVEIPHSHGLEGHSDADVLLHAICDALFGAAGLPDIGYHFPPDDEKYRNASSTELLKTAGEMLFNEGFEVVNTDSIIICEEPKIAPYTGIMKKNISRCLRIGPDRTGVKATTTEKMGFTGRKEGIAAKAVALLKIL